ncbi:iq calmodulin-binding motif domain-containing protein [Cryptosporidium felis]|nr:iq calmodulin-binding motif domain-containing protein [Cryptosporidium felis]
MNNENVRSEKENGYKVAKNETIVYKIVNYMSSLIGGLNDNMGKSNPCIGILSPMSPIMISDQSQPGENNTMVLPTPEPIIQLMPNRALNNNLFLNIYTGEQAFPSRFGPKITPFINLNDGLMTLNERGDQVVSENVSFLGSPKDLSLNSFRNRTVNAGILTSKIRSRLNDFAIIRSPMNSCLSQQNFPCSSINNQEPSTTEILVSPELAKTLQEMITIITNHLESEDSENKLDQRKIKGCIRLNKFQRINKRSTIGGLNFALMSYSASIIQRHYREFDNNRIVRNVNPTTRSKYSKNQILNAIQLIQKYWRIYMYRNQLMKEFLIKSVMAARNAASCRIASFWKGYKTRKLIDSVVKDVSIKWVWNREAESSFETSNASSNEHTKFDVKLRGSFTCKPWQEHLKLDWNEQKRCFILNVCLSKGIHYLQFIINNEIKACGSMEIVVLPIIGVSNKINIAGESYKSSFKRIRSNIFKAKVPSPI